jgi:hypothetical protein
MLTPSLVSRLGRFRALAVSGAILGSLVAGSSAIATTSADAATTSTSAACGEVLFFFPPGDDALLMTQPATGFRYLVTAYAISQFTPVGYVASQYEFPGQPWHNGVDSALNTLEPTEISSFGVELGYDFATRLYDPEVIYSTCTWTAQFYA